MAMTEEEQKAFDEAKSKADKLAKELEALRNPPTPNPSILDAARKKEEAEQMAKEKEQAIISAAKFAVTVKGLLDEAEGFFPAETQGILSLNAAKNYDSELERANDLRSNLIESVFSQQKNLDLLSKPALDKVNAFLALSQKKREEKAGEYWEYVETALDNFKRMSTLKRVNETRSGIATSAKWEQAHEDKIFGKNQKKEQ